MTLVGNVNGSANSVIIIDSVSLFGLGCKLGNNLFFTPRFSGHDLDRFAVSHFFIFDFGLLDEFLLLFFDVGAHSREFSHESEDKGLQTFTSNVFVNSCNFCHYNASCQG